MEPKLILIGYFGLNPMFRSTHDVSVYVPPLPVQLPFESDDRDQPHVPHGENESESGSPLASISFSGGMSNTASVMITSGLLEWQLRTSMMTRDHDAEFATYYERSGQHVVLRASNDEGS